MIPVGITPPPPPDPSVVKQLWSTIVSLFPRLSLDIVLE